MLLLSAYNDDLEAPIFKKRRKEGKRKERKKNNSAYSPPYTVSFTATFLEMMVYIYLSST